MRFRERYSKPRRGEQYARVHDLDIPGAVQLAKWSGVSASTATWCAGYRSRGWEEEEEEDRAMMERAKTGRAG